MPSPHPYLVGLVGTGVGPSLTPALHMAEGRAHGLDYVYRTLDLDALGLSPGRVGELLQWARALGYDALNITHPCKQLVLEHLDDIEDTARELGAVNTVLFRNGKAFGHNTDITGFAHGFGEGLAGADTGRVVLVGAGGAGTAVAAALLRLGAGHLTVVDLDPDRATALAADLTARHPLAHVDASSFDKLAVLLPEADGIVHATPTGMAQHPGIAFDPALLHPRMWVADIVYRPLDTALLRAARDVGCRTLDGGHMAVHQAVDAFALITGISPDAGRMSAHFRELVG
ncbi:shikimate 5-dehydrogenase [Mycolicibacterium canariasense]|uniref:Shikimate 5-dehydrogenase n=1 Tax=Mycolicibacterium canariasense TaxID=228230 RepID=A0A117I8E5_MYCCR|nr:shikimate dehydrogenase [Mycolicibacterium canariasense]MCV7211030.1 shikimate dehydrogenase [Mycolicibacterium canariasense]ORV01440.1 shikimate dehydrogenase [Mycolicibacterium canariasense]GAS93090.1 shikimate 5-dehydrogenase [Mycolicibacterium canariasense]